ncbi:MAG: hypothetical protein KF763_14565 [Cyclobacteriaceae bacterium]|nr:hypothetical protein [Cyclobacteriaceae bacterium]
MKRNKQSIKILALMLVFTFMVVTSFRVNASSAFGSTSSNVYKTTSNDSQQMNAVAPNVVAAALVAGFEVGVAVGAVVGIVSGFAYQMVTNFLHGVESIASLDYLNYDPNDLSKFDN